MSLPWSVAGVTTPEKRHVAMLKPLRRGYFGIVHIENDAVQKRTLLRIGRRTIQPGGFRLIREATPTTVGPALNLCQDTVQRELAELLA